MDLDQVHLFMTDCPSFYSICYKKTPVVDWLKTNESKKTLNAHKLIWWESVRSNFTELKILNQTNKLVELM